MILTPRDTSILETLTQRVRLLSLTQIAKAWWGGEISSNRQARRRLRALSNNDFVTSKSIGVAALLELKEPQFIWEVGDESEPDYTALSGFFRRRWTQESELQTIYFATKKSAKVLGGVGGKLKRPTQIAHDLHVGEVYLVTRQVSPEIARLWISEDRYQRPEFREKHLDAIVGEDPSNPIRAIEFCAAYSAAHLRDIHAYCTERELPYELW